MAAYDAQWLFQTDKEAPLGSEPKSLGDDAIREIKVVLQNMFSGSFAKDAADEYTGTLSDLNQLVGAGTFPRNAIIAWAPATQVEDEEGPTGWTICDGRLRKDGLGGSAPDLRARFLVGSKIDSDLSESVPIPNYPGARPLYLPPDAGSWGGDQELNMRIEPTSLTMVELGSEGVNPAGIPGNLNPRTSGAEGHNHGYTVETPSEVKAGNNIPPFYSVLYLIKD